MTARVKAKIKTGRKEKYSPEIVKKICHLVATEDFTIDEICERVGISDALFYEWKLTKVDFVDHLKKAEEKRLEVFRGAARSGLLKLLKGTEYEETIQDFKMVTMEDGTMKATPKQMRRLKKIMQPNPIAAIFALKNVDGEVFQDIDRKEISTRGPINITLID